MPTLIRALRTDRGMLRAGVYPRLARRINSHRHRTAMPYSLAEALEPPLQGFAHCRASCPGRAQARANITTGTGNDGAMVAKTHNPVLSLREIALLLDAYDIDPLTSSRSQNRARLPRRAFCDGLQA